jgi:predicted ferric reductase
MFLGLAIRTPLLNRIIKPVYSFRVHCWISLQALIFALIHGLSLLGDKFVNFNLGHIFVPFFPQTSPSVDQNFLALGIIGFYLMVILVASSYWRNGISYSFWRGLHFLNVGMFIIIFIHSLFLGTDMKIEIIRNIFIWANVFIIILMFINFLSRMIKLWQKNAAVYQGDAPGEQK